MLREKGGLPRVTVPKGGGGTGYHFSMGTPKKAEKRNAIFRLASQEGNSRYHCRRSSTGKKKGEEKERCSLCRLAGIEKKKKKNGRLNPRDAGGKRQSGAVRERKAAAHQVRVKEEKNRVSGDPQRRLTKGGKKKKVGFNLDGD